MLEIGRHEGMVVRGGSQGTAPQRPLSLKSRADQSLAVCPFVKTVPTLRFRLGSLWLARRNDGCRPVLSGEVTIYTLHDSHTDSVTHVLGRCKRKMN